MGNKISKCKNCKYRNEYTKNNRNMIISLIGIIVTVVGTIVSLISIFVAISDK